DRAQGAHDSPPVGHWSSCSVVHGDADGPGTSLDGSDPPPGGSCCCSDDGCGSGGDTGVICGTGDGVTVTVRTGAGRVLRGDGVRAALLPARVGGADRDVRATGGTSGDSTSGPSASTGGSVGTTPGAPSSPTPASRTAPAVAAPTSATPTTARTARPRMLAGDRKTAA